jgi:probable phosphoglycerate mutase
MNRHQRTDLGLLPEGVVQAQALGPPLAEHRFAEVLTSPLRRARATCELAGLGEGVTVDPDLAEWDYGAYEGLTTPEIRSERPGWDLFADGAPGGETITEVGARVDRVIQRVRSVPGDAALVAHSHVLRVLAVRWIGLDPGAGRGLVIGPASISVLGWEREHPVIVSWNR